MNPLFCAIGGLIVGVSILKLGPYFYAAYCEMVDGLKAEAAKFKRSPAPPAAVPPGVGPEWHLAMAYLLDPDPKTQIGLGWFREFDKQRKAGNYVEATKAASAMAALAPKPLVAPLPSAPAVATLATGATQ